MKARVRSGKLEMAPETRAAMEAEAKRMAMEAIDEMNRNNEKEIDSMILYILHTEFGFGEKRLRRFYDRFSSGLRELGKRYQMETYEDRIWLCERALREAGIDISEWSEENANNK